MVTLLHPGRVGEARGDERKRAGPSGSGRGRAEAGGVERKRAGSGRGAERKRAGPGRGDEAGPGHLRAPERGDAVP